MPELCKKSLTECSADGGKELFIIGKNFTRGTKVWFQQVASDGSIVWSAEAPIDQEYFHQVGKGYAQLISSVNPSEN